MVTRLYKNGEDLGTASEDIAQANRPDDWLYSDVQDALIINESSVYGGTDPNLDTIEAGDVWEDVIERFRKKASRLVESKLGKSISREILKDREGNYPTSIIHITALKTVILLIMAHDPNHPDLISLNAEYDDITGKILSGRIIMTGNRSENDSKGIIRIVEENTGEHEVYPIELRGSYKGSGYELLKVTIRGSLLVSSSGEREDHADDLYYSVWGKSDDNLKDNLLIDNELVSGDYQFLGVKDLFIRWGFSEWKAGSGDVLGTGTDPIATRIESGENGWYDGGTIDNAILYTGPNGAKVQDLYDDGYLQYITHITARLDGEIENIQLYEGAEGGIWQPQSGNLSHLYYSEDINYRVIASATQDEILYKDGLSIWSDFQSKSAEYEIELWGSDIQPTISQIKSTTLSRDTIWL